AGVVTLALLPSRCSEETVAQERSDNKVRRVDPPASKLDNPRRASLAVFPGRSGWSAVTLRALQPALACRFLDRATMTFGQRMEFGFQTSDSFEIGNSALQHRDSVQQLADAQAAARSANRTTGSNS